MKTLILLLFGFIALQCNDEGDRGQADNMIKESEQVDYVDAKIPLNWPWRGVAHSIIDTTALNERKIKELKAQGINAIRFVVKLKFFCIQNNVSVEGGLNPYYDYLEKVIQWCAKEDIVVILNSKDFPLDPLKNFDETSSKFWDSVSERNLALSYINDLVLRFDKHANVVAYDFFSEPVVRSGDDVIRPEIWFDFFKRIVDTIRMNSDKYVVFSPGLWGMVQGYSDFKEPFADDKIIYGFHFYLPQIYTHQGIRQRPMGIKYPGLIELKYWDAEAIRYEIGKVGSWAKEHNKLIYVGEFSVVRWAEGKDQYLEDVLTALEENKFGYTYHSLNNWKGWDMNYEVLKKGHKRLFKSPNKTITRQLLEKFWQKNVQH